MREKIDLHIHSCYSDGTMRVSEIIEEAKKQHVKYLAISDHDVIEGSKELLATSHDLRVVSGVELNAFDLNQNIHVLGYGVDLENENFAAFCKENRARLEYVNERLIQILVSENRCSFEEYQKYTYEPTKGGWKALHFLVEKGICKDIFEGFQLYADYGVGYDLAQFPSVQEVCHQIHLAGGKAILAHPGRMICDNLKAELEKMICNGIDGLECYYPTHTHQVTQDCLALCKQYQALITCGSDSHGGFQKTTIGQMDVTMDDCHCEELFK